MSEPSAGSRHGRRGIWMATGIMSVLLVTLLAICGYRGFRQQHIINELGSNFPIQTVPILGDKWREFAGGKWQHAFSHAMEVDRGFERVDRHQMKLIAEFLTLSFNGFHLRNDCKLHLSLVDDEQVAMLAGISAVKELTIFRGDLSAKGLDQLARLPNLTALQIINNGFTDGRLAHVQRLDKLESLALNGNGISDDELKSLTGMTNLQSLDLRLNAITDVGFRYLTGFPNLSTLNIEFNEITDEGLAHLQTFPKLTQVSLSKGKITEEGIEKLKRDVPRITVTIAKPDSKGF